MGEAAKKKKKIPRRSSFGARTELREPAQPEKQLLDFIEGKGVELSKAQPHRLEMERNAAGRAVSLYNDTEIDRAAMTLAVEYGYKKELKQFCYYLRADEDEDTPEMSDILSACITYGWDQMQRETRLGVRLLDKASERRSMTRLIQFPEWRDPDDGQDLSVRVRTTINIEAELKQEIKEYVYTRRGQEGEDTPDMNDICVTCFIHGWGQIQRETALGTRLLGKAYERREETRRRQYPEWQALAFPKVQKS